MPRGTELRNFRCDDERWQALGEIAAEDGTDRTKLLIGMIDALREERVK